MINQQRYVDKKTQVDEFQVFVTYYVGIHPWLTIKVGKTEDPRFTVQNTHPPGGGNAAAEPPSPSPEETGLPPGNAKLQQAVEKDALESQILEWRRFTPVKVRDLPRRFRKAIIQLVREIDNDEVKNGCPAVLA